MIKKIGLIVALITAFITLKLSGLESYLSFEGIKLAQQQFQGMVKSDPVVPTLGFFAVYALSTALSFPGATLLTLLAGALFGTLWGTVLVSFASTLGATLAFISSRYLLRDGLEKRYAHKLKFVNEQIKKQGSSYLFSLRLVPLFPFFLVNILMGLTPIPLLSYIWVSQIGMLPGTLVYVNAGTQLGTLEGLGQIASPGLLLSFAALGLLPFIMKKALGLFKAKKVYRGYKRPTSYDYNMVAIGAGAGGLVTSYIGAAVNARVALIERHKMGGDCLNTGCVPSKAIIQTAKVVATAKKAQDYGLESMDVKFDFAKVMERVQRVITKIEPHDSVERYEGLGVECIQGSAKILSPWKVEVNGRVLTTKNITIATGARPRMLDIPGIKDAPIYNSDTIWNLRTLPKNFVVVGSGPIGCELAQAFARLGAAVHVVSRSERILTGEDAEVSTWAQQKMVSDGVSFHFESGIESIQKTPNGHNLVISTPEGSKDIPFDACLLAVGRDANVSGFGLEELGVELRSNGTIETNEYMQTNFPNIFACGDVTGPYQLTHMAAHQAWYCAVNGLFGRFKSFKADYSVVPWCTYTDPEVATVGHTEQSAQKDGVEYDLYSYELDDLDRAITDDADFGIVRVLTQKGTDRIIGASIAGQHASTMILEFITAMKVGKGLNMILGTIHIYPSMGEANKYVAGVWKKTQAKPKTLELLGKFHKWSRS